ncbi:hypothetical protein [Streptomyces sp. NPDC054786]
MLRQALDLEYLARRLVDCAVIAEREGGATWERIARVAGTTRQSVHERWSGDVQLWARLGRVGAEARPTMKIVNFLDRQYAKSDPALRDAISAGPDATRHPGSAAYEGTRRTHGQQLHARRSSWRATSSATTRSTSASRTRATAAAGSGRPPTRRPQRT